MRKHPLAAVLFIIALSLTHHSALAENRTKETAIQELLEITGTDALVDQQIQTVSKLLWNQITQLIKKAYPTAPDELFVLVENELVDAFMDTKPQFFAGAVKIYSRHYSLEEIEGLIAFYRTPLGDKLIRTLPTMMGEMTALGALWGERVAAPIAVQRVKAKLQERGYDL